jgi:hypothetical protein
MWIFKSKTRPTGQIKKLKAQVVAKGNEQEHGIHYLETFVHVVRWTTIRSIIALVAKMQWRLRHLDVIIAFLNSLLLEEVYMIIPASFPNAEQTCKLLRALYGLRQASRAWYSRIDNFLTNLGLTRSNEDPNLYYSIRNGLYTIILLYINDIIITGDDEIHISKLKKQMMTSFKMSDLGDANYYLGVEILQTTDGIYFHQRGYLEKILECFGMIDCTPISSPMNPKTKLQKDTGSSPVDPKLYQSFVGALLHATISRWDIQYLVSCVSRYLTNPQMDHLIVAKKYFTIPKRQPRPWHFLSF